MTEQELKPCPFCGSPAELCDDGGGGSFVECKNRMCAASTNLRYSCGEDARPLVVEQWNRRASGREQLELVKDEAAKPEPAKPQPAPISEDDVYTLTAASMICRLGDCPDIARQLDLLTEKLMRHLPVTSMFYRSPATAFPPQEPRA